jgi:hypothetical protein
VNRRCILVGSSRRNPAAQPASRLGAALGWRICHALAVLAALAGGAATSAPAAAPHTVHVAPHGDDAGDGSRARPFASLARAQAAVRALKAGATGPLNVELTAGTYRLRTPLVFTTEDSGSPSAPITWTAAPGAEVRLTGSVELRPTWRPWRNGILRAAVPAGLRIDQFFVGGVRQIRARFPNFDPANPLRDGRGYVAIADAPNRRPDPWVDYDPATFSPRVWQNPTTGILHGFQSHNWGNMQYRLAGVDRERHRLLLGEGGWQLQRAQGLGRGRNAASPIFVENLLEELDAPGEWFHDPATATLSWLPPAGLDPAATPLEAVVLANLIEVRGTAEAPVRHLAFQGLSFTKTATTFLERYEPVARGDWAIHRGGVIFFTGAEDCAVADCRFDYIGGNAVFLSGYNRRAAVQRCRFHHIGESAVALVGLPSAVRNYQTWDQVDLERRPWIADRERIDRTPGPQSPDYPAECLVEDCAMSEIGDFGKQVAGVFIAMSRRVTVRHCTIHGTARAAICINDGTWGGHLIADNDIWDTVRETGEHGPFNSWGRDRMWLKEGSLQRDFVDLDSLETAVIRHNRIANYRASISAGNWTIDLDDGSSRYEIYDNLSLGSTLKLRDGFRRTVWNNIFVSAVPLGLHVWPEASDDRFFQNVTVVAGARPGAKEAEAAMIRPIRMRAGDWARGFDRNLYWNANTRTFRVEDDDWSAWRARGFDPNSVFADPQFVDPSVGDYRVRDDSPARALGFRNFAMDGFGHRLTRIAPAGGEFAGRLTLTFTPDDRGGEVRYTLDGSAVRPDSPRATEPLTVDRSTTVRARTYRDGQPVGFEDTAYFSRVETPARPSWLATLLASGTAPARVARTETHEWFGAVLQSVAGDGDLIDATGGLDSGLFVRAVTPGSAAQRAGLQASDVIIACNGRSLRQWADLAAVTAGRGSGPLQLEVRRNQSLHRLELTPVPSP